MEREKYTKEYFIKKFEAIPKKEIGKTVLANHCALWHCGVRLDNEKNYIPTDESVALCKLFGGLDDFDFHYVWGVNDGNGKNDELGSTPKERILNKLKSL